MGKKVTKSARRHSEGQRREQGRRKHSNREQEKRYSWISTAVFFGLLIAAVGMIYGMARLNDKTVPSANDAYVRQGSVEVAAQPLGGGFGPEQSEGVQALAGTLEGRGSGASALGTADGVAAGRTADGASGNRSAVVIPEQNTLPAATPERNAMPDVGAVQPGAVATAEAPVETMPAYETLAPVGSYEPTGGTITITATGDCTLGGNVPSHGDERFDKYVQRYGYDYFLEKVRPLFESDDLTIVNLEGPLTTSEDYRHGRGFNFRGKPEYIQILSGSSIEIANVANNHALDYGVKGLKETAQLLEDANIGCSGFGQTYDVMVKGIRVRSIGFTEWDYTQSQIVEGVRQAREGCDLLIVSMHWGREGQHENTGTQRKLGRAVVDAGADLVIGNHPHVYEGIEKYNGKYIIYSLGNFCFGGNGNPADKRCYIFQQRFSYVPGYGIIDNGINLIPALISGEAKNNNFQPVIMEKEAGAKLLKAIAKESSLHGDSVTWMSGNYIENNGQIAVAAASDEQLLSDARPTEYLQADATGAPTLEDALRLEVLKGK